MPFDVNKVTICWPNRVDTAALSGGAYTTQLPLSNAKSRVFAEKARSVDTATASTQFTLTLTGPKAVGVVSIASHNFSSSAKIRVVAYKDAAKTDIAFDSTLVDVWPALFESTDLEWEFDNFWFGGLTEEERDQFTPLFYTFFPDALLVNVVDVFIEDTANPAGFVEFGRVFIGDAWQPKVNMELGCSMGYVDESTFEAADDGTEYFDERRRRRTFDFRLPNLDESEAYNRIYSLNKTQGITKEILVAYSLQQTPENFARVFIGRQRQIDALANPYLESYETQLSLLEIL